MFLKLREADGTLINVDAIHSIEITNRSPGRIFIRMIGERDFELHYDNSEIAQQRYKDITDMIHAHYTCVEL